MLKTDSWQGIIEFAAVVEQTGFSAAARRLGTSVSHVSRQVEKLEQRLGVTLLTRTTRKMKLTEAGEKYFSACKPLIAGLEEANHSLAERVTNPKGQIRISTGGKYVAQEIGPILLDFMTEYPQVSIELHFSSRKVNLIEEGFDMAIRFGPLQDSSLTARKLVDRELVVCASPTYLASHGKPTHPDQLENYQCLAGNVPYWRFQVSDGFRDVRVAGRFRCGNPHALAAAAERDMGLIYVPRFYVASTLETGRLVTVLDDFVTRDKATWLLYPEQNFLPARNRLLIDYLMDRAQSLQP